MLSIIHYLDAQFISLALSMRIGWLTAFFLAFTMLGKSYVVAVITAGVSVLFWRYKKIIYIIPLWISVGGGAVSVYILKHLITRPRPVAIPIYIEDSYSFPSGHAGVAIGLYGFLLYFCLKNIADKIWRRIADASLAVVIILLGFSRIYLGVHYFSDVIAGFLVGGIWLAIAIYYHKHPLSFPRRWESSGTTSGFPPSRE